MSMNAQTILMGDMNHDEKVTIADVTSLVNVILGKAPQETISAGCEPYKVDNSSVVGTWYAPDDTHFTLNEDGTTDYGTGFTYKFRPCQGTLTFYDAAGEPVKVVVLNDVTTEYLVAVDYASGTFTKYTKQADQPDDSDKHEYVDLGLPSGTLWATCNIGANSPEEYGDYFAWGELEGYNSGKTEFYWSTYKWCEGTDRTMTKYCNNSNYGFNGFTDDKTELDLEDDAAYVNWGAAWRMPSIEQLQELINGNYTIIERTTQNGVYGRKITSKMEGFTDKSIFLPDAGCRNVSSLYYAGSYGNYWSRTLYTSTSPLAAWYLYFESGSNIGVGSTGRCYGRSVRPVRSQNSQ